MLTLRDLRRVFDFRIGRKGEIEVVFSGRIEERDEERVLVGAASSVFIESGDGRGRDRHTRRVFCGHFESSL